MNDDVFDKFLYDMVNNKNADRSPVATEESGVDDMTKINGESLNFTDESDEPSVSEKTIRFTDGDVTKMVSAIKNSGDTQKVPDQKPKPRRKKKVRKANYTAYGGLVLATIVLCASIVISLFVIVVGRDFLGIDTNDNGFTLYIESGSDIESIADLLVENGIIEYPEVFVRFARFRLGADGMIYPGDIDVKPSMSYADLIDSLSEMREAHKTITVTIPEGYTIDAAAKLLEESGVCSADEFIFAFNTNVYGFDFETYVSSSSLKYYKYEGYLFPDTYEFYEGDSVYNIAKKIKERTNEILNADVIRRCNELGYTLDQIVTLASILELESGKESEMKEIAGVFYNRLSNPAEYPRLQSDTTSRYIENVIKADSTVAYQEMYDAYDTYVCVGLPVGAICNPGKAAIDAALYPNANSYYYFCSSPETGEFYYAETYDEHLENKETAGLEV